MKSCRILFGLLLVTSGMFAMGCQQSGDSELTASDTTVGVLPPDIYADSLNRLPLIRREELDKTRQKAFDEAASSPEGLRGLAGIRLHASGVDVRYNSPLGRRLTELAINTNAAETDQPYEWTLHAEEGMRQGLEREIIDLLRFKQPLTGQVPGLGETERAIIQLGREAVTKHKVSSETYAAALKVLGKANLVDIVTLIAGYSRTSVRLAMVDQHLPADWKHIVPLQLPYDWIGSTPKDIDPGSRSRLPLIKTPQPPPNPKRPTLAPWGTGPNQLSFHAGKPGELEANIGRRLIELTTLVTAREVNRQYLWTIHELEAAKAGLEPQIIDVVRNRQPLAGIGEKETSIIQLGREVFGKHFVASDTYAQAVKLFGEKNVVDLAGLMGEQAGNALILTAVDQHLPPELKPLLPDAP
jgi:4-carboxymuconolactone decarboxylase